MLLSKYCHDHSAPFIVKTMSSDWLGLSYYYCTSVPVYEVINVQKNGPVLLL